MGGDSPNGAKFPPRSAPSYLAAVVSLVVGGCVERKAHRNTHRKPPPSVQSASHHYTSVFPARLKIWNKTDLKKKETESASSTAEPGRQQAALWLAECCFFFNSPQHRARDEWCLLNAMIIYTVGKIYVLKPIWWSKSCDLAGATKYNNF